MPLPLILRLDVTGRPVRWVPWQDAACLYTRDMVAWTAGEHTFALHGGYSRVTGVQTVIEVNSIIAVRGEYRRSFSRMVPPLNNRALFRRDRHTCMYCGLEHPEQELTRDHVVPMSRGGRDGWSNVVTACKRCNAHKGRRTPDEARMPLLAVPYAPNMAEYLVLRNRRILADQMEFLKSQFRDVHRPWGAQQRRSH
jgi:5-methylcytosine-specific restriction endonuclease McrA